MPGLNFGGLDLVNPINRLRAGVVTLAVNVRAYIKGGYMVRNPLSIQLFAALSAPIHSIRRLNDSTPNGPPGGYTLIVGAGTNLYAWNPTIGTVLVASGLSGNPLSMVPFRPNASVQPWMYIGDSAPQGAVTIYTKYLTTGAAVSFVSNGLLKVRSDGYAAKTGVKEPQTAPVVSTQNTGVPFGGTGALLATAIPWTNYPIGTNASFNYGETEGPPNTTVPIDGTPPFIIDCQNATTITITQLALDGTVVITGVTNPTLTAESAGRVTAGAPGWPGQFIQEAGSSGHPTTASYVVGAFTDGNGNVLPAGVAPVYVPNIVDVGLAFATSASIAVPYGAVAFQVGINSEGNTFSSNSGLITFAGTVTTNALPTVLSILGSLSLNYWGDSPSSGPVGSYIWKNSGDPSGGGPVRSNTPPNGTDTGNSFIFDATFTSGIPGLPGIGTNALPMEWTTLNPDSVAIGSAPVFPAPLITTYPTQTTYANFNFTLTGQLYFPGSGHYTLVMTSHDDAMWGLQDYGSSITLVSVTTSGSGEGGGTSLSQSGQTLSAQMGYPLMPRQTYTSGENGNYAQTTIVLDVVAAGIYGFEIDFDYWDHSGRILLVEGSATAGGSPTVVPPLPASVRQAVQYRYVYRSSATGAESNPSPESTAEAIPVNANTITSIWSPDPQIDVVDYYRIDESTADYTYVATGPNDDLGGSGTNTPITDSLTDTELGTQLLEYDNFEPFPSVDLPQKGTVSISGGVITWVSGGAIGGTQTGFNLRWLAGTTILIGSPTSLAYEFIARPTSTTTVVIPNVPDAVDVAYEIPQPILANQPLAFLFGPTDNVNYCFGLGDDLRPGGISWCNPGDLDAAADTNYADVTDPSESLVNGCLSAGRGVLASIKRVWIIAPNFFNALATATGTTGSQWSFKATPIDRGLFMPWCICVAGGGTVFFRVDDGIDASPGGSAAQSITDQTLYPLFSHEGSTATAITRNGVTIYPPDDTQPHLQRLSEINGYLYYDYQGTDGNPHTLTFDIGASAWIWDVSNPASTIHAANEDVSIQGCLVGCSDGTVRQYLSSGAETVTGIVITSAIGGKGFQHIGEIVVEYSSMQAVALTFVVADDDNNSYAPQPVTLPSTGGGVGKFFFKPTPAKWKLLQFQFSSTDPQLRVFLEGCIAYIKAWGVETEYLPVMIFAGNGGEG